MDMNDDFIKSQKAYLQDLIAFKAHPLLLDHQDKMGWQDWEHGYLAYVTRKDALSVLGRVFAGELTFKQELRSQQLNCLLFKYSRVIVGNKLLLSGFYAFIRIIDFQEAIGQ